MPNVKTTLSLNEHTLNQLEYLSGLTYKSKSLIVRELIDQACAKERKAILKEQKNAVQPV